MSRDELLPVPPFDPNLLPDALRPWCADVSARMQCPADFVAVAAMIVLAAVVGRQVGIRPKQRDAWQVIPNLWGLLVGRPGVMKSPAMREATRPLLRLEIGAKERYEEAMREYQTRALVVDARRRVAQKDIKQAVRKGDSNPDAIAGDVMAEAEAAPVRRRFIVNDPTPEKLQVIMAENPNGVAIVRDKAQGLLRSLDKPGREDARAFYIESWEGDGRFTVDRIGRGTLDVPACCASILATIQPGPLRAYLWDAVGGGEGDDGLAPRFQLAVLPDVPAGWRNLDRWPNTTAKQQAFAVIEALANIDAFTVGAETDDHHSVPFLRFAPEAQTSFDAWRGDLKRELRTGRLPEHLEAVLAKYRSLVPSLAILTHLADGAGGPVGAAALDKAVGWSSYLFAHARRIYGMIPTPKQAAQDELAEWIRGKGGTMTSRDLTRGPRQFRGDAGNAEAALDSLVRAGRGHWQPGASGPKGGRPNRIFVLGSGGGGDGTPEIPAETPVVSPSPASNIEDGHPPPDDADSINRLLAQVADEEPQE